MFTCLSIEYLTRSVELYINNLSLKMIEKGTELNTAFYRGRIINKKTSTQTENFHSLKVLTINQLTKKLSRYAHHPVSGINNIFL